MRGKISREGAFTLTIQWVGPDAEMDCDSCESTINGEAYTIMMRSVHPVVLCRTCAHELGGDLEYALS